MKLSYNWLGDYIDLSDIEAKEVMRRLTLTSCEIESVSEDFSYLEDVHVARIISIEKHPNADKLNICKVQSRSNELQIICGASNVKLDMLVALAPIGTKLIKTEEASQNSNILEIRKAKIRGIESFGMICSANELGLSMISDPFCSTIDGVLDLSLLAHTLEKTGLFDLSDLKLGRALNDIFPLKDFIFDVDNKSITHRADLWSHFGFAREISAIFNKSLRYDPLDYKPKQTNNRLSKKAIHIEKGAALAYHGISLSNIAIKPAPLWMQCRLLSIGQRPINNVVDVSNYIMFDIGQPNHAFDACNFKEDSISICLAKKNLKNQSFTALDEIERDIPPESILIYDGLPEKSQLIALGGVIGGLSSGISQDTNEIFIESATFPRSNIRKTISNLNLRTDAAQRFEKGQDPAQVIPALYRFSQLLKESCPDLQTGLLCGSTIEKAKNNKISIDLTFIQKRLGFAISNKKVESILEALGFKLVSSISKSKLKEEQISFSITVPTYRSQYDVSIAEDIVEELGRFYGYDNIAPVAPYQELKPAIINSKSQLLRQIRDYLVFSLECNETYNYSFVPAKYNLFWNKQSIPLKNPTPEHRDELRLSLLPGLLEQANSNQHRFNELRLFEIGHIYWQNKTTDFKNQIRSDNSNPNDNHEEEIRLAFVYMSEQNFTNTNALNGEALPMLSLLLYLRQKMEAFFSIILKNNFRCVSLAEDNINSEVMEEYLPVDMTLSQRA